MNEQPKRNSHEITEIYNFPFLSFSTLRYLSISSTHFLSLYLSPLLTVVDRPESIRTLNLLTKDSNRVDAITRP